MGIYLAAAVATAVAVWAGLRLLRLWIGSCRTHRWVVVFCVLGSPAINVLVKRPLLLAMLAAAGVGRNSAGWPWWLVAAGLLMVGVTEELVKLLPLLIPSVRRQLRTDATAVPMSFAIGLGFAVGEIWYLARSIARTQPQVASLPVYMLGGFVSERAATVVIHSALTLIALSSFRRGPRRLAVGVVAAILAHAAIDFTPALFQRGQVSAELATIELLVLTIICSRPFLLERKRVDGHPGQGTWRVLLPPRSTG